MNMMYSRSSIPMSVKQTDFASFTKDLFLGGASGCLAKTVCAPLERVRFTAATNRVWNELGEGVLAITTANWRHYRVCRMGNKSQIPCGTIVIIVAPV